MLMEGMFLSGSDRVDCCAILYYACGFFLCMNRFGGMYDYEHHTFRRRISLHPDHCESEYRPNSRLGVPI
jgi:hypothetical protein